jgi:hypothetical protein
MSETKVPEPLAQAVRDVCWKATPYGEDDEGFVTHYLLSVGPIHRLVAAAQGIVPNVALRNAALLPDEPADAPQGDPGWWVISGDAFRSAMTRAHAGEDPAALYIEFYANTEGDHPGD